MFTRREFLAAGGAAVVLSLAGVFDVLAHHGWRWAEDGNFELTGIITAVQLGNPHGVLTVDAEGEAWTVEVGQPWRNERAGLSDAMLAVGREVTVSGARSADAAEKRVKAERVIIDGQTYNLYPDRD
ncbi:MAG: hypothetical protein GEU89_04590 [Kiloniellaceae bacterium]|nr:hypothetical protein [Kiloniellaceae bacterium]